MLSKTELWDIFTGAKKPGMREGEADDAGLRAVAEAAVKDAVGGEPVAWMYTDRFGTHFTDEKDEWYLAEGIESVQPLYASPQDTPRASQHAVTGRVGSNRGQGSGETTC